MVLAELGGQLRQALRQWNSGGGSSSKAKVQALLQDVSRALLAADVPVALVQKLRADVMEKVEPHLPDDEDDNEAQNDEPSRKAQQAAAKLQKRVQQAVVQSLVQLLTPKDPSTGATIQPYTLRRGRPNIVLFVGLQGAGKTTTVAKYCRYYQRRGFSTAMVCADTFRAGALDQLKQNATKLRIPFYGSYRQADPVAIAQEGVAQFTRDGSYDCIVVDTSGRHQQEAALFEEMMELAAAVQPNLTILVLDATQGQAVYDQAAAFHAAVPVGAVICTKLDGHAKGGGALSAVAATQSPILFLGQGEHFDDLHPFVADSFVSQLLGMGDVKGLIRALRGDNEDDARQQKEWQEGLRKGEFTLRMMYQQFEKILSLGSLGNLAGMMPGGVPQYLMPNGAGDKAATDRLRKFMVMMDSMKEAELDGRVDWHNKTGRADPANLEKRRRRIAAGSGCHPTEVLMLLQAHQQMANVVQKMKGLQQQQGNKQQMAQQKQMAEQWRRNPALMQQHLNAMDPKLVAQMGGRENVLNAMQQMARGGGGGGAASGGMPDLSSLMGGGGGGIPPGMGMPPGGGMPDMATMMQQMQQMGLGGGGPGGGGMPDMATMQRMMQQMGMGGGR